MKKSLSKRAGSSLALNKEQPVELKIGRDRPWNQGLTDGQYRSYWMIAQNIAYLIVGNQYEAELVADKVMDELWKREQPPSKAEVEKHLRILTKSRALDCLKSPMHRLQEECRSLVQRGDDEEEYEAIPESYCSRGAEEEFFFEQDRQLFAKQFAEAVSQLSDLQRVCFVLRLVEGLKPEEIAEILNIPATAVSTQAYRARNKVARLLTSQEKEYDKHRKRGRRSSQ
jgi:RNA polymerase sigma factor (sigma-70 family)